VKCSLCGANLTPGWRQSQSPGHGFFQGNFPCRFKGGMPNLTLPWRHEQKKYALGPSAALMAPINLCLFLPVTCSKGPQTMPKTNGVSPSFKKQWNKAIRQITEAEISTRDLEAVGIDRRTFQRNKNRRDGPRETVATREIIERVKPLIAMKADKAAERAQRLLEIAKQLEDGKLAVDVAMAGVITTLAATSAWLCFTRDFGFGLMSGLGYSI
jgi:hypothetical protein